MALIATKGEIPKDAVVLNRSKAVLYQWQQIEDWPIKSDVWPFRWGIVGLSALAAASGYYINARYRRKFKLRHHGFVSTSFPIIVAPGMFSSVLHIQVVTNDLFLNETKCPLCLQYRAALVQTLIGVVYPIIMAPLANALFAIRHASVRIPYWKDYKATLSLWWKFTKPLGQPLLLLACVQALAGSAITYVEAEKLYTMRRRISEVKKAMSDEAKICNEPPCK